MENEITGFHAAQRFIEPQNHQRFVSTPVQQIECATDIMFKQACDLEPLYDEIIRTAIFTVKPDNIAAFLGQRITYNCKKEVGTNYNQRILGTRIKHHMGDVSIIIT
jgi:hypothetical protein